MMRRIVILSLGLACGAALVWAIGPAPDRSAEAAAEARVGEEIKASLTTFVEAFRKKDIDTLMSVFGEHAVVMGTGPGELWIGKDEIRAAHVEKFKSFDEEKTETTWVNWELTGDVAWALRTTNVTDSYQGQESSFQLNMSVVVAKQGDAWKIMSMHTSKLTAP